MDLNEIGEFRLGHIEYRFTHQQRIVLQHKGHQQCPSQSIQKILNSRKQVEWE